MSANVAIILVDPYKELIHPDGKLYHKIDVIEASSYTPSIPPHKGINALRTLNMIQEHQ